MDVLLGFGAFIFIMYCINKYNKMEDAIKTVEFESLKTISLILDNPEKNEEIKKAFINNLRRRK